VDFLANGKGRGKGNISFSLKYLSKGIETKNIGIPVIIRM